ncbi:MAG TPA: MFS transporter [Stellaceae bacterium]|nr:MFS transporter [Stellaceae bacterium]
MAELAQTAAMASEGDQQRQIAARIERLPLTWTQIKARVIVGSATFFDGYDSIMLGLVMPVIAADWHLSNSDIGFLLSGTFFGQLLGALLFPYLAERLGRLRACTYSVWVVGLMSLACVASWNFTTLASSRIIQGIGIGGEIPVAATYINEIAPSRIRGRFFLLYEALFVLGYLIAALLGVLLISRYGWQIMFVIGAAPALIAAVMRRTVPESPRWLASKGRGAEADAIVAGMEREAVAKLGKALPPPDVSQVPLPPAGRTNLRELFDPYYRMRTLVIWSIWGFSFFVTQALVTWMPTLYRQQLHLSVQQSLQFSLASQAFGFLAGITVALLIDRTGRRAWIGCALLCGSVAMFTLGWQGASDAIFVLVCATIANFALGTVSASVYMYTCELYPTRMRALGTGMGSTVRNIFTTLSPTLVALMLNNFGLPGVFIMLGIAPLVPAFMILYFGVETSGRVLEELSP